MGYRVRRVDRVLSGRSGLSVAQVDLVVQANGSSGPDGGEIITDPSDPPDPFRPGRPAALVRQRSLIGGDLTRLDVRVEGHVLATLRANFHAMATRRESQRLRARRVVRHRAVVLPVHVDLGARGLDVE